MIADLYNHQTGQWDLQRVEELMGSQQVTRVEMTAVKPTENRYILDRLIWLPSKTGNYTVKEGYNKMRNQVYVQPHH